MREVFSIVAEPGRPFDLQPLRQQLLAFPQVMAHPSNQNMLIVGDDAAHVRSRVADIAAHPSRRLPYVGFFALSEAAVRVSQLTGPKTQAAMRPVIERLLQTVEGRILDDDGAEVTAATRRELFQILLDENPDE